MLPTDPNSQKPYDQSQTHDGQNSQPIITISNKLDREGHPAKFLEVQVQAENFPCADAVTAKELVSILDQRIQGTQLSSNNPVKEIVKESPRILELQAQLTAIIQASITPSGVFSAGLDRLRGRNTQQDMVEFTVDNIIGIITRRDPYAGVINAALGTTIPYRRPSMNLALFQSSESISQAIGRGEVEGGLSSIRDLQNNIGPIEMAIQQHGEGRVPFFRKPETQISINITKILKERDSAGTSEVEGEKDITGNVFNLYAAVLTTIASQGRNIIPDLALMEKYLVSTNKQEQIIKGEYTFSETSDFRQMMINANISHKQEADDARDLVNQGIGTLAKSLIKEAEEGLTPTYLPFGPDSVRYINPNTGRPRSIRDGIQDLFKKLATDLGIQTLIAQIRAFPGNMIEGIASFEPIISNPEVISRLSQEDHISLIKMAYIERLISGLASCDKLFTKITPDFLSLMAGTAVSNEEIGQRYLEVSTYQAKLPAIYEIADDILAFDTLPVNSPAVETYQPQHELLDKIYAIAYTNPSGKQETLAIHGARFPELIKSYKTDKTIKQKIMSLILANLAGYPKMEEDKMLDRIEPKDLEKMEALKKARDASGDDFFNLFADPNFDPFLAKRHLKVLMVTLHPDVVDQSLPDYQSKRAQATILQDFLNDIKTALEALEDEQKQTKVYDVGDGKSVKRRFKSI